MKYQLVGRKMPPNNCDIFALYWPNSFIIYQVKTTIRQIWPIIHRIQLIIDQIRSIAIRSIKIQVGRIKISVEYVYALVSYITCLYYLRWMVLIMIIKPLLTSLLTSTADKYRQHLDH